MFESTSVKNPAHLKLFCSHRWGYSHHRLGPHDLLETEWIKNIDFFDFSIPKEHPVDVASDRGLAIEIRDRIRASDCLLVMAGKYSTFSEWVKFEVHMALADNCPIIAVAPNGADHLSTVATGFASVTVRWRGEQIRSAVLDLLPVSRRRAFESHLLIRGFPLSQLGNGAKGRTSGALGSGTMSPATRAALARLLRK